MALRVNGKILFSLVCSFGGSLACRHVADNGAALKVVNGKVIGASEHPEVVLLGTPGGKPLCTGTFITHELVLTAAHCTRQGDEVYHNGKLIDNKSLTLLSIIDPAKQEYKIQAVPISVYRHPLWLTTAIHNKELNKYDIGLVEFPKDTSPYVAEIAANTPKAGDDLVLVGYGLDYVPGQYDDHVDRSSAGTKRLGTNTVEKVEDGMILFNAASKTTKADGLNSGSSQGDSGGPMFVHGKLVGVTSGGSFSGSWKDYYTDATSPTSQVFIHETMEYMSKEWPKGTEYELPYPNDEIFCYLPAKSEVGVPKACYIDYRTKAAGASIAVKFFDSQKRVVFQTKNVLVPPTEQISRVTIDYTIPPAATLGYATVEARLLGAQGSWDNPMVRCTRDSKIILQNTP